ncbi:hypothetical protein [Mobiluncus mulieris]|uniref:hypothetical protein n=1 Tax=Mobiluncus mulieris TaxID=2052 RepID=UPI0015F0AFF2|nr:hypothetical protein [Mobiluncus mulieris]
MNRLAGKIVGRAGGAGSVFTQFHEVRGDFLGFLRGIYPAIFRGGGVVSVLGCASLGVVDFAQPRLGSGCIL